MECHKDFFCGSNEFGEGGRKTMGFYGVNVLVKNMWLEKPQEFKELKTQGICTNSNAKKKETARHEHGLKSSFLWQEHVGSLGFCGWISVKMNLTISFFGNYCSALDDLGPYSNSPRIFMILSSCRILKSVAQSIEKTWIRYYFPEVDYFLALHPRHLT